MKILVICLCVVFAVPQFVLGENNVTTVAPTSTKIPDTTTTLKPNTTTTAPVTTTVEPTPAPEKDAPVVHYVLRNPKQNHSCLMAEFSAVIELKYNNTKGHMETGYLLLSNNSKVSDSSRCDENETTLVIMIDGKASNTLTFVVEKKNNKYFVRDILFNADEESIKELLPLAPSEPKIAAAMLNQTLFEAPATKSYMCKTPEHYKMTSDPKENKFEVTLDMKDVRFDAFRTSGDAYRDGQLCSDDTKISDTVPIIVGAALAALVVIVLIAYFIGRRRSRRLAYQSV